MDTCKDFACATDEKLREHASPPSTCPCPLGTGHLLQVAQQYYTVFIKTLRREWFGIDHLRLDKFLMLIRKFIHQLLRLLQAGQW